MVSEPLLEKLDLGVGQITVARYGDVPPFIVMLHDGLGSITQWREVPALIAEATGTGVLVYDRAGHGQSTPAEPSAADWLHDEAELLKTLVDHYGINNPLLVGHSDGGSIALIYASSGGRCSGLITLAAHSFVEDVCVEKISVMKANPGPLVLGLARHHGSPKELFESWSGVWTSTEFRSWDIRPALSQIACPVLVVQGDADAYATDAQLTETADAIGSRAKIQRLAGAGHVLHHEVPDVVVEIVNNFYDELVSQQS